MTKRTTRDELHGEGALTAYGAAVGPMILMALKPIKEQEPEAYAALMQAVGRGQVRLQLVTIIGHDTPSQLVLNAVDGQDHATMLSALELTLAALN